MEALAKGDKDDAVLVIRKRNTNNSSSASRQSTSIKNISGHRCSERFKRRLCSSFTVRILDNSNC